ncbi:MAG: hypothetical protein ACRD19_15045 [Terriglobia bacterium]
MIQHDFLWLAVLAIGAINAWLTKSIKTEILLLKLDLIERIAKTEGDVKALRAGVANKSE